MNEPFGRLYAGVYDSLYAGKRYGDECDLIEKIFREYGAAAGGGGPVSLLDLGCGTGRHLAEMAARGYRMTGVDLSEGMLATARDRCGHLPSGQRPELVVGNICSVRLGRRFDHVMMMFAVLGYMTSDADLAAALATVRQHLNPGGLFLFDCWYGPAVLAQKPEFRERKYPTDKGYIHRISRGELQEDEHCVKVTFRVACIEDGRTVDETEEEHVMRYFSAESLMGHLKKAGMDLLALRDFNDFARDPDTSSWSVFGVARAV